MEKILIDLTSNLYFMKIEAFLPRCRYVNYCNRYYAIMFNVNNKFNNCIHVYIVRVKVIVIGYVLILKTGIGKYLVREFTQNTYSLRFPFVK